MLGHTVRVTAPGFREPSESREQRTEAHAGETSIMNFLPPGKAVAGGGGQKGPVLK